MTLALMAITQSRIAAFNSASEFNSARSTMSAQCRLSP
jgi:hypothetical protein